MVSSGAALVEVAAPHMAVAAVAGSDGSADEPADIPTDAPRAPSDEADRVADEDGAGGAARR